MARVLAGIGRSVEELRAPEVPDRAAVAMEHVQHRPLASVGGLGVVVAVVGVAGRRQKAQRAPASLPPEGQDALERRLRDDREVDVL